MQVHLKIDFTLFQFLHILDGVMVLIHFDIGKNSDVCFSCHILLLFISHMNEITIFHYRFNKEHDWGLTPCLNNIIVKASATGA